MAARLVSVEMVVVDDLDPDASLLEQDGFDDRLEAYRRGDFSFVGVCAVALVEIPHGDGHIVHRIESPGLWGIESDSDEAYLEEVFEQEKAILDEMLGELRSGIVGRA